ncbi:hypothetical protein [Paenibacillus sp. NPDC058174]|uniref:hypothetical protein n=1 Tax=Paenibacillus sp. NPDC058174 TaxID=3346366 RepID=UPI0036DDC873
MGSGGYSGAIYSSLGGGAVNKCGDTIITQIIVNQNKSTIWLNSSIQDMVYINLNRSSSLPILEVLNQVDGMLIGLLPPNCGWVINCIENGWKYQGIIIKKEGSQYDPKITVNLNGVI